MTSLNGVTNAVSVLLVAALSADAVSLPASLPSTCHCSRTAATSLSSPRSSTSPITPTLASLPSSPLSLSPSSEWWSYSRRESRDLQATTSFPLLTRYFIHITSRNTKRDWAIALKIVLRWNPKGSEIPVLNTDRSGCCCLWTWCLWVVVFSSSNFKLLLNEFQMDGWFNLSSNLFSCTCIYLITFFTWFTCLQSTHIHGLLRCACESWQWACWGKKWSHAPTCRSVWTVLTSNDHVCQTCISTHHCSQRTYSS